MLKMIYSIFPLSEITKNAYTREEKNFVGDYSMVLLNNNHLCDTIISENIDISCNNMMETGSFVLPSLHISLHVGDAKYRI